MKTKFLSNILLMLIWVFLTGEYNFNNFLFGFGLSFIILWILSGNEDRSSKKYFKIVPKMISFVLFFLWELTKANIQVAYEVITPKFNMKPGIVALPLDAKTDLEITLLANLITLTPGTLALDVSTDRSVLYVHAMYVVDKKDFIEDIKQGFERRLLEILR
ncbi:Na+/H+ antiporter subunit E [Psychroflexus sp. CAK57W]|uniref:Na+/H+ antiporter subunit E n=1 Tax=Psychroflexus curvus TaxID=2873595 RepID=UPI001CCD2B88|nr:Na+/H+ antiporter subunit E [Psychroflexus curvus]MBZ9628969.1 Na+/H+ antiporter subunit E [Psychroflexus curvus]MBZ9787355.1 Na+/H+ antiporter subunit E [Psychroflexus curvus]